MSDGAAVVVDTSAIVAILQKEADADSLLERALRYESRVISASTWLETAIVCESRKKIGGEFFDQLAEKLRLQMIPFTATQASLARDAFKQYGKGRGSKAALSFGDCFSYALAKELDAPLLFKGNDFVHTDVTPA